jgi:hypothetical protein
MISTETGLGWKQKPSEKEGDKFIRETNGKPAPYHL